MLLVALERRVREKFTHTTGVEARAEPSGSSYEPEAAALDELLDRLADVYQYVHDCQRNKEAAPTSRPEDAKKGSRNDSRAHRHSTPLK
jgi:hypothetical protein